MNAPDETLAVAMARHQINLPASQVALLERYWNETTGSGVFDFPNHHDATISPSGGETASPVTQPTS